jgi:protein-tyrosine phosphatase
MRQVLFLCSANYYRSRFAEHFFNHRAIASGATWRADSRGLMVGYWGDIGPISVHTVEALQARQIRVDDNHREPAPLTLDDLHRSELVVAVKEIEHREMMRAQFPDWEHRVEYWDVDDLDCATPDEALPYLAERVESLLNRLQEPGSQSALPSASTQCGS